MNTKSFDAKLSDAEEQLEALRQRYLELFDFAPDGYLVTDLEGVIQEANRAAAQMLQARQDFLPGKPLAIFVPDAVWQETWAHLERLWVEDAAGVHSCMFTLKTNTGAPVPISAAVSLMRDAAQKPVGLRWLLRDMSAQIKSEEAIRQLNADLERRIAARTAELYESEARYRALVEQTPSMVHYLCTLEGNRALYVSPQIQLILGFTQSEWIQAPGLWRQCIHPDDRARVQEELARTRGADAPFESEYRMNTRAGAVIWVRDEAAPVRDEQGRALYVRGLMRDITAPKEMELERARLYAAEQQARQIADLLRTAHLALSESLDLETVLETLLDHMQRLVPYTGASVLLLEAETRLVVRAVRGYSGWSERDQIRADTFNLSAHPLLRALVAEQKSILLADTHAHPDWDQSVPDAAQVRSWLGVPLLAGGHVIGLFSLDQTAPGLFTPEHQSLAEAFAAQAASAIENAQLFERVRASGERLRYVTKQLVAAQEQERQRLSRELHDEAGQALTALKITLELLKADLPKRSAQALRQRLDESIQLAETTLEQMRLITQGLRPPALDALGLNLTLQNYCHEFARRTKLPVVYTGGELPALSSAVSISFYRLLQEGLTNVLKHAHANRVRVTLGCDVDAGEICLVVEDDGRGFERRKTKPAESQPLGIGLVGLQERFALLGGRLEIHTQPGLGTRLEGSAPWQEGE